MSGTDPDFHSAGAAAGISFVDGATSDIVLTNSADLTIQTNNGTIDIEPQIKGTGADANTDIVLNASGSSLGSGAVITLDNPGGAVIGTDIGTVDLTAHTINLSNDIETDAENITISGAVVLTQAAGDYTVIVTTGTDTAGNISFDSTIDAADSTNPEVLTLISGTGTTSITGEIGGNNDLAALTIQASASTDTGAVTIGSLGADASTAGATSVTIGHATDQPTKITFNGTHFTSSGAQTFRANAYDISGTNTTFTASGQNITFAAADTGDITLSDSTNLTINTGGGGGNVSISDTITNVAGDGDDATDVTITAGSGTVAIAAISGDINDVAITSTTSITLSGDITTAQDSNESGGGTSAHGDVTLTGKVLLAGDITIDTDSTGNNGDVTITGALESSADNGEKDLTVISGSGPVNIGGTVGGTDLRQLGALTINGSSGSGTIEVADIGVSNANAGVDGDVTIGNAATTTITFDGALYLSLIHI